MRSVPVMLSLTRRESDELAVSSKREGVIHPGWVAEAGSARATTSVCDVSLPMACAARFTMILRATVGTPGIGGIGLLVDRNPTRDRCRSINGHVPIDAVVNRTELRMLPTVTAKLIGSVAHMVNGSINLSNQRTRRSRYCQWLAGTSRCFEGSFSPHS